MEDHTAILAKCFSRGIPLDPLPEMPPRGDKVPHAPIRTPDLTPTDFKRAVANALRYFPSKYHEKLAPEFAAELRDEGHIYMRRFRPTEYAMKAYPVAMYPGKFLHARCIMHMIMNNLDPAVAQFPEELITYGGNGSVLSNWAQYHLLMYYLSQMTDEQTLTLYSGHPMGLFPSTPSGPRMIVTNGMVIPNYSSKKDYDKMYAMGVSQFGQMTAGSFCYIGPQGIVHGTTITILNAARKYLQSSSMAGKVYVSSGLGGMSGAQGKAGYICGAVTVIAEVDAVPLNKRFSQGWINEICDDVQKCIARIKVAREKKEKVTIGYHGNVVTLWEALAAEKEMLVELGSDQTSLHNPFSGGYYPVQLSFEAGRDLMQKDPAKFKALVQESLVRHVTAVNALADRGMKFWDYGNSFLLEASRAGADILKNNSSSSSPSSSSSSSLSSSSPASSAEPSTTNFKYPTYIQEFMGNIFSLGFGPFRWVCTSGRPDDLAATDAIAAQVLTDILKKGVPEKVQQQVEDNLLWITEAGENKMVVGSQARILYADAVGRATIAAAFNKAIKDQHLSAPVVLSRDHHDVSGTDSPWRETSNVYDGSQFCADMAVHNCIGDAFRGATWVALHNGGGCGWGEVMNGGFGLVLDGTQEAFAKSQNMLDWDVNNGIARRAWAGNDNANLAIDRAMAANPKLVVTKHVGTDEGLLDKVCK